MPPETSSSRPRPRVSRLVRVARIAAAAVLAFHSYYVVSRTLRMSSSLFPEHDLRYDAPSSLFFGDEYERGSSSSSGRGAFSSPRDYQSVLPGWLADYFDWHRAVREKYPGDELLTDPDAPGLLIKACAYKCGGLHDRLGGLGWDLYFANQTRRIFLIHWCIPAPIEHYLVPNLVDWTLPWSEGSSHLWDERLFSNTTETHIHCDRAVGDWKGLFDGYAEYMQGEDFFERNIDLALDRASNDPAYSKQKVLRYKVLGVDQRLEQRLRVRHNETDAIAWTDSFPAVFWTLFRPSEGLQTELDGAYRDLGIDGGAPFYAVHARIRHPRGHIEQEIVAKGGGGADKGGLSFEEGSSTRAFAIRVAQHALECADEVHLQKHPLTVPRYFFHADSEDLVSYVGKEHADSGVRVINQTGKEVLHIDRQQQRSPEKYYGSFVDVFVAARASCIFFGAGNYALLAAKINTRGARECLVRHYPDSSHLMVVRTEFTECNETWGLVPTRLEREISDIPVYKFDGLTEKA